MHLSPHNMERIAQALVELDVVRVATHQPFIYTTGWASPVYVDVRALMSDVQRRCLILDIAAEALRPTVERKGINAVVGTSGAGIAFAAWLSERLGLPLLYLRKRPVGWGMGAHIEGRLPQNARVLLVDDVTTDARSKADACAALRKCGAQANDVMVLVNFDIYPQSNDMLARQDVTLHALVTWPQLFAAYAPQAPLSPVQRDALLEFNASPVRWSLNHGGVGA